MLPAFGYAKEFFIDNVQQKLKEAKQSISAHISTQNGSSTQGHSQMQSATSTQKKSQILEIYLTEDSPPVSPMHVEEEKQH